MIPSRARWWPDLAFYPVVVGLALVLQLVAHNGIGVWASLRSFVAVALLAIAATGALRVVLGDRDRSGIAAMLAIVGLLASERAIVVATALGIVILVIERRILGGLALPWPKLARVMRGLAAILCLAILVQAVQVGAPTVLARSLVEEGPLRSTRSYSVSVSPARPDVYVILLDGYARADVLDQVFGVDESSFLAGLTARGVAVSAKARTNYATTAQVLIAMFNARLLSGIERLKPLADGVTSTAETHDVTHALVADNLVFDTLRSEGYEIVAIDSGFADVGLRRSDRFITPDAMDEIEVGLLRSSVLGDLLDVIAPDFVSGQHRQRITAEFQALGDLAAERPGHPRFIFAHVPSPHPPWVFNADGSPRTVPDLQTVYADDPFQTGLSLEQLKSGYAGAIASTNALVLDALDAIDQAAEVPPVVIIFGDHGSWVGADPGDVRLRFLPLLAARVPGVAKPLADDESLVNVFPDVLNPLLGTSLPRVDPAPSFMFRNGNAFDLAPIDDPDAAVTAP